MRAAGRILSAERWALQADGQEIRLWYGPGGRWLGLESRTEGGRVQRYELVDFGGNAASAAHTSRSVSWGKCTYHCPTAI